MKMLLALVLLLALPAWAQPAPDANRERDYNDRRKPRMFTQASDSIAEIFNYCFQGSNFLMQISCC